MTTPTVHGTCFPHKRGVKIAKDGTGPTILIGPGRDRPKTSVPRSRPGTGGDAGAWGWGFPRSLLFCIFKKKAWLLWGFPRSAPFFMEKKSLKKGMMELFARTCQKCGGACDFCLLLVIVWGQLPVCRL